MRMTQPHSRSVRGRSGFPRAVFEAIEQRLLLSADIVYEDGLLSIRGDGTSNTIIVTETWPVVEVVLDERRETFRGVRAIDIDAGEGDNVVKFHGPSDIGIAALRIVAGSGADEISADFKTAGRGVASSRMLRVEIDAGGGADRVAAHFQNINAAQGLDFALRVAPGATPALPEVGDEVLVAFEHGDVRHPCVLGTVWNTKDAAQTDLTRPEPSLVLKALTTASRADLALTIEGGAGDDQISTTALLLPAVQKFSTAAFRYNLGEGQNTVEHSGRYIVHEATHIVQAGGGADRVELDLGLAEPTRDPRTPIIAILPLQRIHSIVQSGGGNDSIDVNIELGSADSSVYQLVVDAGDGDNTTTIRFGDGLQGRRPSGERNVAASYRSGGGNDTVRVEGNVADGVNLGLNITTGGGNDEVAVDLRRYEPSTAWPCKWHGAIDLGDGDNQLHIRSAGFEGAATDIKAGDGNNGILIGLLLPAVQKVREAAAWIETTVGDGNNNVEINIDGYSDVHAAFTAGDGDNVAKMECRNNLKQIGIAMHVGDGDNFIDIVANTGAQTSPAGPVNAAVDIATGDGNNGILIGLLLPAVQKVREAAAQARVELGSGDNDLTINVRSEVGISVSKPKEIVVVGSKIQGVIEVNGSFGAGDAASIELRDVAVDGRLDARISQGATSTAERGDYFQITLEDVLVSSYSVSQGTKGNALLFHSAVDGLTAGVQGVVRTTLSHDARQRVSESTFVRNLSVPEDASLEYEALRITDGTSNTLPAARAAKAPVIAPPGQAAEYNHAFEGIHADGRLGLKVQGTTAAKGGHEEWIALESFSNGLQLGTARIMLVAPSQRGGGTAAFVLGDGSVRDVAEFNITGGAGDDTIVATVRNVGGEGDFAFRADGRAGNDLVFLHVERPSDLSRLAQGTQRFEVLGGAGDDILYLAVHGGHAGRLFARIDGGPGRDACFATKNVEVVNCESHIILGRLIGALRSAFGGGPGSVLEHDIYMTAIQNLKA